MEIAVAMRYELSVNVQSDAPIDPTKLFTPAETWNPDDEIHLVAGDPTPPPPIPPSDTPSPPPPPVPNYIPPIGDVWVLIVNGAIYGTYTSFVSFQYAVFDLVNAAAVQESGSILIGWAKGEREIPPMFQADFGGVHIEPDFGGRGGGGGVRPTTGLNGGGGSFGAMQDQNAAASASNANLKAVPTGASKESQAARIFRQYLTSVLMRKTGVRRGDATEAILDAESVSGRPVIDFYRAHGLDMLLEVLKALLAK